MMMTNRLTVTTCEVGIQVTFTQDVIDWLKARLIERMIAAIQHKVSLVCGHRPFKITSGILCLVCGVLIPLYRSNLIKD